MPYQRFPFRYPTPQVQAEDYYLRRYPFTPAAPDMYGGAVNGAVLQPNTVPTSPVPVNGTQTYRAPNYSSATPTYGNVPTGNAVSPIPQQGSFNFWGGTANQVTQAPTSNYWNQTAAQYASPVSNGYSTQEGRQVRPVQPPTVPQFVPGSNALSLGESMQLRGETPPGDLVAPSALMATAQSTDISSVIPAYGSTEAQALTTPQAQQGQQGGGQPSSFMQFLSQDPSLLAGTADLGTNLYGLGRAIGFDPNGENVRDSSRARRGRTFSLIGHTGSALLQGARSILSGVAQQQMYQQQQDEYYRQQRLAQQGQTTYLKKGGVIREFADGGTLAEVEDGEFLRTPGGTVEEVQGRTHEQGGELYLLDALTEVTSDNLKIGQEGINRLQEQYPELKLNIKANDTYADVIRKAERRLQIPQKDEELESTQSRLENLDTQDPTTYEVSRLYLENKIGQLTQERQALENARLQFVDTIFSIQEQNKSGNSSNRSNSPSSQIDEFFKNGGRVSDNQMKVFSRKTGYPISYVKEYFTRRQSAIHKMEDGGTPAEKERRRMFDVLVNQFRMGEDAAGAYGHQSLTNFGAGAPTSGQVSADTFNARVNEIFRIFPQADRYFNTQKDDQGNITELRFKTDNSVRDFQQYINRVYRNHIRYADQYITDPAENQEFKSYINSFMFDEQNPTSVRAFDNTFGDFTSSRSNIALPLVTDSELQELNSLGINNFSQIFNPNTDINSLPLSPETRTRLNGLRTEFGEDFEAGLLGMPTAAPATPATPAAQTPATQTTPAVGATPVASGQTPTTPASTNQDAQRTQQQQDLQIAGGQRDPFRTPYLPNQYRYDFDTVAPHMLLTPRFGRLNPVAVDPTNQVRAIYDAMDTGFNQLEGSADAQRLSVTSNIIAGTQAAVNQAIVDAETRNAANQQTVDQFNIGQGNQEEIARINQQLGFEQRQLTAMELTNANNNRLAEHNRNVTLQNFNTVNRLRTIHNVFPDYGVDQFGGIYRASAPDRLARVRNNGYLNQGALLYNLTQANNQPANTSTTRRRNSGSPTR